MDWLLIGRDFTGVDAPVVAGVNVLAVIWWFAVGAVLGSFACCQARRLRLRERGVKNPGARSICLSCKTQLKWYDNIPVVSWLLLRGRCRKCRKPIGYAEILSEVGMGIVVVGLAYYFSGRYSWLTAGPYLSVTTGAKVGVAAAQFLLALTIFTIFWILLLYDGWYGRLPTKLLVAGIGLSAIYRIVDAIESGNLAGSEGLTFSGQLLDLLGAVGILAGVYYVLYVASHERWVGGGDWLLGLSIALLLGDWWLALVELFLANVLALFGYLLFSRKKKKIPLGPYLIIACVVVFVFQDYLALLF